jgi:hypothetical protein
MTTARPPTTRWPSTTTPQGAPLLFDNRGLPMKDMNWTKGYEPVFRINGKTSAPRIGNVVHCEGGFVAESKAYDNDGKAIEKFDNFQDGPDHMLNFIESVRAGKITKDVLHVAHGHHAAALAHMANVSYRLGKKMSTGEVKERLSASKAAQDTFGRLRANLEANQIDLTKDQPPPDPGSSSTRSPRSSSASSPTRRTRSPRKTTPRLRAADDLLIRPPAESPASPPGGAGFLCPGFSPAGRKLRPLPSLPFLP